MAIVNSIIQDQDARLFVKSSMQRYKKKSEFHFNRLHFEQSKNIKLINSDLEWISTT